MPTIKDKLYFNLDGKSSKDFNLINVVLDSSMYEETLVGNRDIVETTVRGNRKPLFSGINESPIEFDLNLAFEKKYTDSNIDEIIRWLFIDYYRPLYFEGKENKIYMVMPVGDSTITHNGLNEGYITIRMRCDSPNVYSPLVTTPLKTIDTSDGTTTISINNDGHFIIYPEISFKKIGAGKVVIESLDDDNSIFEINGLTDQEDIYINSEKEIIETDIIGVYRYGNIVGDFPRLLMGTNRLKVTGRCAIQVRYKLIYRF